MANELDNIVNNIRNSASDFMDKINSGVTYLVDNTQNLFNLNQTSETYFELTDYKKQFDAAFEELYKTRNNMFENFISAEIANYYGHQLYSSILNLDKIENLSSTINISRNESNLSDTINGIMTSLVYYDTEDNHGTFLKAIPTIQRYGSMIANTFDTFKTALGYPSYQILEATINGEEGWKTSGMDGLYAIKAADVIKGTIGFLNADDEAVDIMDGNSIEYATINLTPIKDISLENGTQEYPYFSQEYLDRIFSTGTDTDKCFILVKDVTTNKVSSENAEKLYIKGSIKGITGKTPIINLTAAKKICLEGTFENIAIKIQSPFAELEFSAGCSLKNVFILKSVGEGYDPEEIILPGSAYTTRTYSLDIKADGYVDSEYDEYPIDNSESKKYLIIYPMAQGTKNDNLEVSYSSTYHTGTSNYTHSKLYYHEVDISGETKYTAVLLSMGAEESDTTAPEDWIVAESNMPLYFDANEVDTKFGNSDSVASEDIKYIPKDELIELRARINSSLSDDNTITLELPSVDSQDGGYYSGYIKVNLVDKTIDFSKIYYRSNSSSFNIFHNLSGSKLIEGSADLEGSFLIMRLLGQLSNLGTKTNYTATRVREYANIAKTFLTASEKMTEIYEKSKNIYYSNIRDAIKSYMYIDSERQLNDGEYNADFSGKLLEFSSQIQSYIEVMISNTGETEGIDRSSYLPTIVQYISAMVKESEGILAGTASAIISLNNKIEQYDVFSDTNASYGEKFSKMITAVSNALTANSENVGFNFIGFNRFRRISEWLKEMAVYTEDGIFGCGQIYLVHELGINPCNFSMSDSTDVNLIYKSLINDSINRMYRKKLFLKTKDYDPKDPVNQIQEFAYEENLSDDYNIAVAKYPQYEQLSPLLTDTNIDLKLLNDLDIQGMLLGPENIINTKVGNYLDLSTIKFLFSDSDPSLINQRIIDFSDALKKVKRNFKTLLVQYHFEKILQQILNETDQASLTFALKDSLKRNIAYSSVDETKLEAEFLLRRYVAVWLFKYGSEYSNLGYSLLYLNRPALIEFLYNTDNIKDVDAVNPTEEAGLLAAKNLLDQIVDWAVGLWNQIIDWVF